MKPTKPSGKRRNHSSPDKKKSGKHPGANEKNRNSTNPKKIFKTESSKKPDWKKSSETKVTHTGGLTNKSKFKTNSPGGRNRRADATDGFRSEKGESKKIKNDFEARKGKRGSSGFGRKNRNAFSDKPSFVKESTEGVSKKTKPAYTKNFRKPAEKELKEGSSKKQVSNRDKGKGKSNLRTSGHQKHRKGASDESGMHKGQTLSPALPATDGSLRLNRFIANAGICSRREADELISQELITVNGKTVTDLGTRVMPGDVVKYNGRRLYAEQAVYILMNKPKDTLTTTDDDRGRRTVMDLINLPGKERIFPVGRLDRNTTGVLFLTNDGDLTQAMSHPKFSTSKVYHAVLDKKISTAELSKLVEGFYLEDGFVQADSVVHVSAAAKNEAGIEIHSGKNRVVRRMFEHLGYEVVKLDRVSFAGLTKKDLKRGHWRYLTDYEIAALMKVKAKLSGKAKRKTRT